MPKSPRIKKGWIGVVLLLVFLLVISLYYFNRQNKIPQRLEDTTNIARNKTSLTPIRPHFSFYRS